MYVYVCVCALVCITPLFLFPRSREKSACSAIVRARKIGTRSESAQKCLNLQPTIDNDLLSATPIHLPAMERVPGAYTAQVGSRL